MTTCRAAALALLLVSASPIAVGAVPAGDTPEAIVAAPVFDHAALIRLYDAAVLGGTLPALQARLGILAGSAASPHARARALLVAADLNWQAGDTDAAMAATDRALALAPGIDALLLKAELTDAAGAPAVTAEWYAKAQAASDNPVERGRIGLRLALLAAMRRPAALAEFARTQPAAVTDRIAPVLALLGDPASALALARPPAQSRADLAVVLRQTEWALAARDTSAQARAWQAYTVAGNSGDRRYALALLVEAYRGAEAIAQAETFLANKPQTPELVAARIDVLLELACYQEAAALVRGSSDPALRSRLLGILDLAGDSAGAIGEYRRQIAADSHMLDGYAGLAAVLIAKGDTPGALDVYRGFFAANRGRMDLMIPAARRMIAGGLADPAIALVRANAATGPAAAHHFLFDAYAALGRVADARGELAALAGIGGAAEAAFVADGYDRLGDPASALKASAGAVPADAATGYDAQLRAADLAERAGKPDEALARWQTVWRSAALPARRGYAEKQIVRLAKQTGTLPALTAALAARAAGGTLRPGEIDLLVALRLAQDDRAGAIADVTRDAARAGGGEAARLRRLAALYTRMRDIPALTQTLRRLVEADPANREDDVRRLVLNLARYGDADASPEQRRAEIGRLLAALPDATPSFRASIYAAAGIDDAADLELRRAAAGPNDAHGDDALPQLAEALRGRGLRAEAAALLVHAARFAPDTAAFATAVGGLLDLLADVKPGPAGAPVVPQRATLRWAERLVLERIATLGGEPHTLGLLADIGQMLGDDGLRLHAYEAAVAGAGDQRAAALRQLVTLATPATGDDGAPALADQGRRLIYMRRLIALGKPFPPDVYAGLAGTLLAAGDVAGAERAFAMMGDMGGLVNVAAVKARAYADRGYAEPALANYARALAEDGTDLDLVVRTSVLREQLGQGATAFPWYWRALTGLVARQPAGTAEGAADAAVDVDRYFPTLVEGMLLTWPDAADATDAAAARAAIVQLADEALAGIDRAAPGTLAGHRRLALAADIVRRLGDAAQDAGIAQPFLAKLNAVFAADTAAVRAAALHADLVSARMPIAPGSDWPAGGLDVQAADEGNVPLRLALGIARGDDGTVRDVVGVALADEIAWRAAIARGFQPASDPPILLSLLPGLADRLSPEEFRTDVLAPIDASPMREDLYFDIFRSAPALYDRAAAIAGHPPIDDDRLVTLLATRGNSPLNASARAGRAWNGGASLDRFTVDRNLALYTALVTRLEHGGGESALLPPLVPGLLAHRLLPAQRNVLAAALHRDIVLARDAGQGAPDPLLARLLVLDTVAENRALLLDAARIAAAGRPEFRHLPVALAAWFAGDRDAALAALYALDGELRAKTADDDSVTALIAKRFPEARQREIDAFLAASAPDAAQADRFFRRFVSGQADRIAPDRLIVFYRKLIAAAPDVPAYRLGLARVLWERGMLEPLAQVLGDYEQAHRDDGDAAFTLILVDRLAGRAEAAAQVARDTGVDPLDAGGIVQLLRRADTEGAMPGLFALVWQVYAQRNTADPVVVAVSARRGGDGAGDMGNDSAAAAIARLTAAQQRPPASVPGLLRGLWRQSASDADGVARRALLRALAAADNGGGFAMVLARADVAAELGRYSGALDASARATASLLYRLGARSLLSSGGGDAELDRLLAALSSDTLAPADLPLLATLADQAARPLPPAARDGLGRRLLHVPALDIDQRIVLARVFARSGDATTALGLLDAALMQLLYPFTALDDGGDGSDVAARIVAAFDTWPDRQTAQAAYAELTRRLREQQARTGGGPLVLPPLAGTAPAPAG
jgi:hypothetical protein